MYQRIDGEKWRSIWVVGDLHGCYQQLMAELRLRHFNPFEDLLISVGDLIDRGPESLRCLQLLDESWFIAVRGNHEQMALDALAGNEMTLWQLNGGTWLSETPQPQRKEATSQIHGCHRLPWIIEARCRDGIHIIAHADYPAPHYRWHQPVDRQQILWSRQRLTAALEKQTLEGIEGADHFWFGHTPLKQRFDVANLHYIDTGAVFGGALTLVQLQ
ncbi:serine/threonine protein phosphatase 1 [Enterobacter sp. BIGb0383]|uniref:protein-serine/threonine phosphatase n=1 Tax=unclassified Enterobacter TaxID=2608935 RepID=UPI000F4A0ECC|nr:MULTISPECIES: protein-serine/threonine phosphatase [unclassified Enterobacter]ROP61869.1 serine/threonine protein phosphatase 1 [Enterobacter sp. BIGb0383]ROS12030.1 serine/threonine protein phosphatase 1 [Enterobacter sp. BIGb0359]